MEDPSRDQFEIDTSVARAARVQNYLAGGDGNFAADREAADSFSSVLPGGLDTARAAVRSLARFMGGTVRYLAGDLGIRQFLTVGVAVPTAKKVHEIAQQASSDARFVYVGDDPVVLAHAHALRESTEDGATAYFHGSLAEPDLILRDAGALLDLTLPVALMLLGTLNFFADSDRPYENLARLVDALAPGSCLAIAHASPDIDAANMVEAAERLDKALQEPWTVRDEAGIARFFADLEMLPPGLVPIDEWHPTEDSPPPSPGPRPTPIYVGIARKP